MSSLNTTSADKILKVRYDGGLVKASFDFSKILAIFPRDEKFGGKNYQYTVRYATSAGMAPAFADAQGLKAPGKLEQFTASRKKIYSLGSVDNELIFATENDEDSLVRGLEEGVDQALHTFGLRMTRYLFGDGTGAVGRISSGSATNEITLTQKWDHVVFQKGDKLQVAATAGGTLRAGSVTVNSVTRVASGVSKIKVDEASWVAAIPACVDNDYIHFYGASNNVFTGVSAHIPASDPTAGDSFRGVDRSVDPVMLAGVRIDGTSGAIEEVLQDAIYQGHSLGADPEVFVMHTMKMAQLAKSLGSKELIDVREDMPELGFKAMSFASPLGSPVKVIGTPFIDYQVCYGLKPSTWRIKTAGQFPRFLTKNNGSQWLVEANDDALELRVGCYGDMICDDPHKNVRIALSAA